MLRSRRSAALIAVITIVVALILLAERGGLIAWSVLFIGAALLAKIWLKPSTFDVGLSSGLATVSVLAWVGTLCYVLATYESGEVVELAIDTGDGTHTARVWVLEIGADTVVYYDAEPEVAESLLAGKPLQFTRGIEVSTRIPRATRVDALPQDEANLILKAMATKYGDRMTAADVYYLMLGRPRDRVAVVASLIEPLNPPATIRREN